MKRLIVLALFAVAAWYGWHHYRDVFEKRPAHEAVIENRSSRAIGRVRLKVDGQVLVKEEIAEGERAILPFRVNHDSAFELAWTFGNADQQWSGGLVPAGPMVQRHIFTIGDGNEVMYRAENK